MNHDGTVNVAPDGSPVGLYLRLPERSAEARLVDDLIPAPATVLDLGCGTGRLAEPLARLGHSVTGVDNEPAMLAALRHARGISADIEVLDLGERFHAVLVMSHFVNTADQAFVEAVLATAARHVRQDGVVVIERHPVGWVAAATDNSQTVDGVRYTLTDLVRAGDVLTATIRYEFGGDHAEQRFSVREVDDARLARLASTAGLRLAATLNPNGTLVQLTPDSSNRTPVTRCRR